MHRQGSDTGQRRHRRHACRRASGGRRSLARRARPGGRAMTEYRSVAPDVKWGEGTKLANFVNLYGCEIGDNTKIGAFVEIQKNARVGKNCKISSHTFVCEGVTIADNVFVGHGVMFINDSFPRATT